MQFKDVVADVGQILELLGGLVVVIFIGALAFTILWRIWQNKIDISQLISEPSGDASMSRLQLLIFTYVISLSLFMVVAAHAALPATFPTELLTLLGISGSSYLVSKAIQAGSPASAARPTLLISPVAPLPPAGLAPKDIANFNVSILNAPTGTPLPQVTWSLDAPALGSIAAAGAPGQATYQAPSTSPAPGQNKVTIRAMAAGFDDGTATITLA